MEKKASCEFIVLTENREGCMVGVPCKGLLQANGFCAAHQYCHDVYWRAAALDFPRLEINEPASITLAGF
jgi:hypothetical protein